MSITYPQYPNTSFPDAIQTFTEYLDITQSDVSAYNAAIEAMLKGDLSQAQSLLSFIPDIDKKVLTAEKLNMLTDTIQALQDFYVKDITPKLTEYQTRWEAVINQFSYMGTWTNKDYKKNSMVSYGATGVGVDKTLYLYIATKDINNSSNPYDDYENAIATSTTPNWFRLTIKGSRGDSGGGQGEVVFRFNWNPTETYQVNDIVVYDNRWWIALKENTNVVPSVNGLDWSVMLESNIVATYPVQANQPANDVQKVGDLWFQLTGTTGGETPKPSDKISGGVISYCGYISSLGNPTGGWKIHTLNIRQVEASENIKNYIQISPQGIKFLKPCKVIINYITRTSQPGVTNDNIRVCIYKNGQTLDLNLINGFSAKNNSAIITNYGEIFREIGEVDIKINDSLSVHYYEPPRNESPLPPAMFTMYITDLDPNASSGSSGGGGTDAN